MRSVAYLCNSCAHLSSSDDRYILNNKTSDSRGRETSADLMREEGHDVCVCVYDPAAGLQERNSVG